MISPHPQRQTGLVESARAPRPSVARTSAIVVWTLLCSAPALGAEIYSSGGVTIRWDTTVSYSAAFRIGSRDPALLTGPNGDDGDRNFAPGLISNRLDILSVFDLSRSDFGAHISAAAWYDTVYHTHTANDSPATYNPISVPNTQFARATRNLHGQYVDLEDAFVYGNFAVGDTPVSIRVGRQTLLWGESLFFDANSIAAAQAPYDYVKTVSAPTDYSKKVYLPVNQLSLTVQPRSDIALSVYYQFEWRETRLPGVGSYFSYTDFWGAGSERFFVGPGQFLIREKDEVEPSSATGQFGISLRTSIDDIDLGFYALKFNATYPVLKLASGIRPPSATGDVGEYTIFYPTGIELYGASFSSYLGDSNIAGEFSIRRHSPLISISPLTSRAQPQNLQDPQYAEGDTLHTQVSSVMTLSPGPAWSSADLSMEVAANYLLGVTRGKAALNPSRDRFAMSLRTLFEPHYFEVLPNLDVTVPIALSYNLTGRSSMDYMQSSGTGSLEIGLSATYRSRWRANISLTNYFGSPPKQPLADRDFIGVSIERTF